MDVLIGDRFIKRFLKGIRPGSTTGSVAATALQNTENTQGPVLDDETCEDLTRDNGEGHTEPQTPGQKSLIGLLPELPAGPGIIGGK